MVLALLASVVTLVNPFIGTKGTGHCFPGAAHPFGLVQASPDTGEGSWAYCSGYQHGDTNFLGFSQTHLSGTGARDLLDFRFTLPGAKLRRVSEKEVFVKIDAGELERNDCTEGDALAFRRRIRYNTHN